MTAFTPHMQINKLIFWKNTMIHYGKIKFTKNIKYAMIFQATNILTQLFIYKIVAEETNTPSLIEKMYEKHWNEPGKKSTLQPGRKLPLEDSQNPFV